MEKEIWMHIPYVADNYEVSNLGRIRNIKPPNSHTPYILNGHSKTKGGKPRAMCSLLTRHNVWKTFIVSKLVALAFVPNPKGYKFVAHINGDLTDDRACNLHWAKSQCIGQLLVRARKELRAKNISGYEIYKYWVCNENDLNKTSQHFKINNELAMSAIRAELAIIKNKKNDAIRYEASKGKPQADIARKYKLSESAISRIIKGER